MPWSSNDSLPDAVKKLSSRCQSVWRRVANKELANGESESTAIKAAWAAANNCKNST